MNIFKRILSYSVFYLIQFSWGLLSNIVGLVLALWMLITGHKPHRCGPYIYFVALELPGSIEGGVFYIANTVNAYTHLHEMGHGLQNMVWGPLMLFVISIPSAIRFWYRTWYWEHKFPTTGKTLPSYDSIWFEGQATTWGIKMWSTHWINAKKNI